MAMDAIASSSFFVPFRQPSWLTFVLTSSSFVLHDSRHFLVHFVGRELFSSRSIFVHTGDSVGYGLGY
jgi:hypothetical protein